MVSEHVTLRRVTWGAALKVGFGIVLAQLIVGGVLFVLFWAGVASVLRSATG